MVGDEDMREKKIRKRERAVVGDEAAARGMR